MLDKYLYLICNPLTMYLIYNPLKINTLLLLIIIIQATHAFGASSIPILRNNVVLLIKIRTINLSNRTRYRAQNRQTFASLHISFCI